MWETRIGLSELDLIAATRAGSGDRVGAGRRRAASTVPLLRDVLNHTPEDRRMIGARIKECVGLMMIGEGVLAALRPHGYARLWDGGPAWWRGMIGPFVRNPDLTRVVGVAEALAGYWLAVRQLPGRTATT